MVLRLKEKEVQYAKKEIILPCALVNDMVGIHVEVGMFQDEFVNHVQSGILKVYR